MRLLLSLLFYFLTFAVTLAAETPLAMNDAFRFSVTRGAPGTIELHWRMPPGYYLYREHLSAKNADGSPINLETAPGVEKTDDNFGTTEVYFGSADAVVRSATQKITVTYRGCQEHGLCYPPASRIVDPATLAISDQPAFALPIGGKSAWSPQAIASPQATAPLSEDAGPAVEIAKPAPPADTIVDRFLSRGGIALALAAFVGFGVLLAFTPCVFPLYPILAATLAREGGQLNAGRGFLLSAGYAVGLASAFAIFGAVAAWTGENLQIALQSPVMVAILAAIFAILALSMFGLFELQLPAALVTRLSRQGGTQRSSVGSAVVLGFSSAFVIGPCVTAPLAGALLYVARTGDALIGAALLFALGLGKGIPLVVFGTAGSKVLPRAGAWMESVKHIFGFIFFAVAIWLAEPVLPTWLPLVLWAILAMTVAIFFGAFDVTKGRVQPLRMCAQAIGLLSAVYAVVLLVGAAAGSVDPLRPLDGLSIARAGAGGRDEIVQRMAAVDSREDFNRQLAKAGAEGKASLVYFTADWCVSCRSIDRSVLSKPDVIDALKPLQAIKVDLTDIGPAQRELMRDMNVVGPPTMIFIRPDQREAKNARLIGEFGADDVLEAAKAAQAGNIGG
ncbi:protein-disulfide reductase DsbD [Rhizobium sp. NPDC090279]|uniref:protein-disulfide reductase DsbD n=1 Tax=Rhizobium sp. NPDC090279 TaxID=3364499 RepID=UPI00383AEEB4